MKVNPSPLMAIAQALAMLEAAGVDILAECEDKGAPDLAFFAEYFDLSRGPHKTDTIGGDANESR